jgi:hypothetical protein
MQRKTDIDYQAHHVTTRSTNHYTDSCMASTIRESVGPRKTSEDFRLHTTVFLGKSVLFPSVDFLQAISLKTTRPSPKPHNFAASKAILRLLTTSSAQLIEELDVSSGSHNVT